MLNFRRSVDNFYLSGGWTYDEDVWELSETYNIHAVLDLQFTKDDPPRIHLALANDLYEAGISHLRINLYDWEEVSESELRSKFSEGTKWLIKIQKEWDEEHSYLNSKILIKCGAGVSRSSAQLIHYLCTTKGISADEALANIRKAEMWSTQFGASPNYGFMKFLRKEFP